MASSQSSSAGSTPTGNCPSPRDIEKAVQSYQKKKEYNQRYYQEKTKPRREQEKIILSQLPTVESLQEMIINLQIQNQELQRALENSDRRVRDLMALNSKYILPDLSRRPN